MEPLHYQLLSCLTRLLIWIKGNSLCARIHKGLMASSITADQALKIQDELFGS
ncbi:hypothetical protein DCAR_0832240 [Daucus carota subsp. sativus]|uniref:Uncharacterized protein n=1 Tax=Daucus carota subsp. sativus TaxID=79200 RepID=A0A175YQ85_DAUCS|nr:hypothetical protein DCAR_0832240 [Daucus carota subsp. sativus]